MYRKIPLCLLAHLFSLSLAVSCIPDRRPLSRPPNMETTPVPEPSGEEILNPAKAPTKKLETITVADIASEEQANAMAPKCARDDSADHTTCLQLGKFWNAKGNQSLAFSSYSRACRVLLSLGLPLAEESSGCREAMALAPSDQAFQYRLMTCGAFLQNPICVDLCRMEIAAPVEIAPNSTLLPPWWTTAKLQGNAILSATAIQDLCFSENAKWFTDANSKSTALNEAKNCASESTTAATACRAAAGAILDSAPSLSEVERTTARRCSVALHEAACMRGKEIAISKSPYTTQSCAAAASKLEQLADTGAEPPTQRIRSSHLYCRAGIIGVATVLRSASGSGILARCAASLASPQLSESIPYLEGCKRIDIYNRKILATPQ